MAKQKNNKTFERDGYCVYDSVDKKYVDEYFDVVEDNAFPYIWDCLDDAKDEIENQNDPSTYEICKINASFKTLNTLKRKVVYREFEDDVDDEE
jgi:hypothetical protein